MNVRPVLAFLLAVLVAVSAMELSTWILGQAESAIVPAASVCEVNAEVPQAPEVKASRQGTAPALTW